MKKYILPIIISLTIIGGGIAIAQDFGATYLFPSGGGLGTTTAPTVGSVLMGHSGGVYGPIEITAGSNITISTTTSSLTITAVAGEIAWSTSTELLYTNSDVAIGGNTSTAPFFFATSTGDLIITGNLTSADSFLTAETDPIFIAASSTLPYWDALSDMSLTEGYLYVGDTSDNPMATSTIFIDSNGYVGIGTASPNAPLEVKGAKPGIVGGFQGGVFQVTGDGDTEFSNSVITGHSAYNTNTQLWYLGSKNDTNNDIAFINRQSGGAIYFNASNTVRMVIDATGNIGIGTTSPAYALEINASTSLGYFAVSSADVAGNLFVIDANGEVNIMHTADVAGDHALEIDSNAAGFGDVKALDIVYTTGAVATGSDEGIILINIDETSMTGGDVFGVEILTTTLGSGSIYGLKTGVGVHPIHQDSGTFGDMDSASTTADGDVLAYFISTASDTTMFASDDDSVEIGDAAKFEEIEFDLATAASVDIKVTFQFSTGVGNWTTFSPVDGTNGFRNTGIIAWDDSDIPTWDTGRDTEYLIRITRTKNNVTTPPVENIVKITATTEYIWTKDGDLEIRNITATNASTSALSITGLQTGFLKIDASGNVSTSTINFTDLTGAATDAQIPDDITIADNVTTSWTGSGNIVTVGTLGSGGYEATPIADAYIETSLTIEGGTINGVIIGASSTAAGSFTDLTIDTLNITGSDTGFLYIDASGDVSTTTIGVADLTAEDFGDFICDGSTCDLDIDIITPEQISIATTTDEYALTYEETGNTWEYTDVWTEAENTNASYIAYSDIAATNTSFEESITGHTATDTALEVRTNALTATDTALEVRTNDLRATDTALEADITDLTATDTALEVRTNSLTATDTVLEGSINNLDATTTILSTQSYKWAFTNATTSGNRIDMYWFVEKNITLTEFGGISDGTMVIDCGICAENSLATSSQIAGLSIDTDGASTTSFVDATVVARQRIKCQVSSIASGTSTYPYLKFQPE